MSAIAPPTNGRATGLNEASSPASRGEGVRLQAASAPEQCILAVWFRSPDGQHWHATGGGATIAEAISFAHESCPADTTWHPTSWNDFYGD